MNKTLKYTLYGIGGIAALSAIAYGAYKYQSYVIKSFISEENRKKIDELHPSYRKKFLKFIYDLEKAGYVVYITSAFRSFEKQAVLNKQDSRNAKAGYSLHNYGVALDINIMKPFFAGMETADQTWQPIVEIAKKNGLDWGGKLFTGYKDRVHFQPKDFKWKGSELLAMKESGSVDKNGFVKIVV